MNREICFFETTTRKPVLDFINDQSSVETEMIFRELAKLEKYGLIFALKDRKVKKIHPFPLYELRILIGRLRYRLIFTISGSNYWFISAILKKTSKIPKQEMKTALARAKLIT